MTRLSPIDEDVRRLAEAGAWRVALAEADVETAPEFESWLADPANLAAWDEVQGGWAAIGAHAESP
jgi:ferric-dicitrate binding protein FerR (iron transport regulator)